MRSVCGWFVLEANIVFTLITGCGPHGDYFNKNKPDPPPPHKGIKMERKELVKIELAFLALQICSFV